MFGSCITKAKKINKYFSGHFLKNGCGRQVFYFYFLFKKHTDETTFFLFHQNLMRHLFVHFKHKNVEILILTSE